MRLGDRLGGTPPVYENPTICMDPHIHGSLYTRILCTQTPLAIFPAPPHSYRPLYSIQTPGADPAHRIHADTTAGFMAPTWAHRQLPGAHVAWRPGITLHWGCSMYGGWAHRPGPVAHWAGPGLVAPGVGPSWAKVWPWQGPCPLALLGKDGCQGSCVPLPSFPGPETRPGLGSRPLPVSPAVASTGPWLSLGCVAQGRPSGRAGLCMKTVIKRAELTNDGWNEGGTSASPMGPLGHVSLCSIPHPHGRPAGGRMAQACKPSLALGLEM